MGITRTASKLEQALTQIAIWQQSLQANLMDVDATNNTITEHELTCFQLSRQLQLATLVIASAYQRNESRGGHFRSDYPHMIDQAKASIIAPRVNTVMLKDSDLVEDTVYDTDKHTLALAAS